MRSERGFTLVELLIAMFVGLLVVGGATMVFTSAIQSEPRTSMRSSQIREGRVMMERVTRELRQATEVVAHSPTYLAVTTYVPTNCSGGATAAATKCRVTYECDGGECHRTLRDINGTGAAGATLMVSGLASDNVFQVPAGGGSPSFVGIRLMFPDRDGNESVTLEDGVALRNAVAP